MQKRLPIPHWLLCKGLTLDEKFMAKLASGEAYAVDEIRLKLQLQFHMVLNEKSFLINIVFFCRFQKRAKIPFDVFLKQTSNAAKNSYSDEK